MMDGVSCTILTPAALFVNPSWNLCNLSICSESVDKQSAMDYGIYTYPLTNSPVKRKQSTDLENCTVSVIGTPIPTFIPNKSNQLKRSLYKNTLLTPLFR